MKLLFSLLGSLALSIILSYFITGVISNQAYCGSKDPSNAGCLVVGLIGIYLILPYLIITFALILTPIILLRVFKGNVQARKNILLITALINGFVTLFLLRWIISSFTPLFNTSTALQLLVVCIPLTTTIIIVYKYLKTPK